MSSKRCIQIKLILLTGISEMNFLKKYLDKAVSIVYHLLVKAMGSLGNAQGPSIFSNTKFINNLGKGVYSITML